MIFIIYLDNAATGGVKPAEVIGAVNYALRNFSSNPGRSGHKKALETAFMIYNTRKKVADFFGSTNEQNVVFTLNCTHSMNCVIKGILNPGDHAIVSSLEHNAVMRPLNKVSKKMGVSYDIAEVSPDDLQTVENFKRLINNRTKLIICTHASNVTGAVLPIKEIGELCKQHGIFFAVDAAQSGGVLKINMQEMNIDYLCVAPHKGLLAPMGIGILISEKPLPNTVLEGGTGSDSINLDQPEDLPERLESGTVNVPAIAGIGAGIDFINKRGIDNLYKHELSLIKYLHRSLSRLEKAELYTPEPAMFNCAPVLSFNFRGFNSSELAQYLSKNNIATRAGLHCAPLAHKSIGTLDFGTLRVSAGYFNSRSEIDFLIKVLKKL